MTHPSDQFDSTEPSLVVLNDGTLRIHNRSYDPIFVNADGERTGPEADSMCIPVGRWLDIPPQRQP
jgi:hypothetical protein